MIDLDGLLRACGYRVIEYAEFSTLVYRHVEWDSTLPFSQATRSVPMRRLIGILDMVRANLTREGKL